MLERKMSMPQKTHSPVDSGEAICNLRYQHRAVECRDFIKPLTVTSLLNWPQWSLVKLNFSCFPANTKLSLGLSLHKCAIRAESSGASH